MADGWVLESLERGIATYRLDSWAEYYSFIEQTIAAAGPSSRDYIWRGQSQDNWSLSSSLDRILASTRAGSERVDVNEEEQRVRKHLEKFKFAARGRRGQNPPELELEDDWWALGQHYGLATPLLDWTRSPFAAAYFAFYSPVSATAYRAVFGLNQRAVELRNRDVRTGESVEEGRPLLLEFINPFSNENPRLVAQGGLFTRAPTGVSVEDWVALHFEESGEPVLFRILIPSQDRSACLRALDRMNINHLSLFPDLYGASRFVNLALED